MEFHKRFRSFQGDSDEFYRASQDARGVFQGHFVAYSGKLHGHLTGVLGGFKAF